MQQLNLNSIFQRFNLCSVWTPSLLFFLLLLLLFPSNLGAQSDIPKKIDSVLASIKNKPYEQKKQAYEQLVEIIRKDKENAQPHYEYVFQKDTTDLGRMILYHPYSRRLSQKGNTEEALKYKLKGLEIAEKLKDERHIINYHILAGVTYLYQNVVDKALYHYNIAEVLAEKPENEDLLWNIYYQKGLMENVLGNVEGQTNNYRKMWELFKNRENSSTKRFALYILVEHFSQIDAPTELSFFTETLADHYEDAHPNTPAGHMPIKSIFEKRTDPSNIPRLKEAIYISDSLNNINSMAYNSIALARTYNKMNRPDLAVPFLQSAIDSLRKVEKPQVLLDVLTLMTETTVANNDFRRAYEAKSLESVLRDSITSEKMQRNIAELEVKFDTEKKERKILEQNLQLETESRQKNQVLIASIALGLLLIISFFFFRKRLAYQKTITAQETAIQKQEIRELQQKNKLLALNSMIEGQEAERLRIAKDLHDSLGGLLSTVKAHFSTIQREIQQLEELNITEKTNVLIDEACIEVRRISHNMMPHALSISGLQGALEDMGENLKEQGYSVSLQINNLPKHMESTKEVMIYRLLQEIISNIRKHANAQNILIQLLGHKNELHLTVEDDGDGFNYEEVIDKGGLGLKSINSRVEYLDGTIHWDSRPSSGTSISINIPT